MCIISNPSVNWNWSYSPETLNSAQNWQFFVLRDLEIWWMTLENNRAPLLYCTKLCGSFQIHQWIQLGVTVWKRSIWVKMGNFLSRVTLKIEGWPCKTIGHLLYATSSFVYHFVPIGEFKLELQSGNAQSGSNLTFFLEPCDLEIWRMTFKNNCVSFHTHWWIQIWVTVQKRSIRVKNWRFFKPCDLEILWMTLKNNRASLLCHFKLCVSFRSHWWIQIWVTVRKRQIWIKCDDF